MIRTVISLLSIIASASSSEHVDGNGNRQLVALETELEALLLVEENEGRTELGRCGARNSCAEGLECVRVGLYKRCLPRKDCLARKLQDFQSKFDTEKYKEMVLEKAGLTESEVVEAGHHVTDSESLRQNRVMNAFIETMQENAGEFDQLGEIVKECSMPFLDEEQRRKLSDSTLAVPSIIPTPAPTIEPQQTVYLGVQIEGGLIFDGLINILWALPKPAPDGTQQTTEMFIKYCLGFGLQGGASLNFLFAVAETPDSERIECLSAFYDLDITVGFGVGYGIGVCLLEEPPFVYQEFTIGVGLEFSASGFSMCNSL